MLGRKQSFDEAAIGQYPAVCGREEVATLAIIGSDRFWVECVDVGVVHVLGIEREHRSEPMTGGRIPIELRVRIDLFHDANVVGVRQRRHRDRIVPIA